MGPQALSIREATGVIAEPFSDSGFLVQTLFRITSRQDAKIAETWIRKNHRGGDKGRMKNEEGVGATHASPLRIGGLEKPPSINSPLKIQSVFIYAHPWLILPAFSFLILNS